MRIVHVIDSIDPEQGGPTAVVVRSAVAEAALGCEMHVVGYRRSERAGAVDSYIREIPGAERIRLHLIDREPSRIAHARSTKVVRAMESIGGIDVVRLHGVWDPALLRAASYARKTGSAHIVTPHGMLDEWTMQQKPLKKRIALMLGVRRMLDGAGAIQALNEHEASVLKARGLRAPICVIPNGVFLDEIDVESDEAALRASIPGLGASPYFLFLSRLHFKKGLDILAEAWVRFAASHPGVRLLVAGPAEDSSAEDFTRRIAAAGLSDTVILPGPVYGPLKTAAFRGSLGFVLPSRQEGFSIAITEALGLGTPVIISRECHFPEVERAGAGVVTGLEPEEIASAMGRLAEDAEARAGMGAAGARLVRENYLWPRIAEQWVEVYGRLVGSGG